MFRNHQNENGDEKDKTIKQHMYGVKYNHCILLIKLAAYTKKRGLSPSSPPPHTKKGREKISLKLNFSYLH